MAMNIIRDIYKYVDIYQLPQIYDQDSFNDIDLPQNMYKLPNIYDNCRQNCPNGGLIGDNCVDVLIDKNQMKGVDSHLALPPLQDLLARQQLLLNRIQVLDNGLDLMDSRLKRVESESNTTNTKTSSQPLTTSSSVGCTEEALNSIKDIVIFCDVKRLPLSALVVIKLLKKCCIKVLIRYHFHSSLGSKTDSHLDYLKKSLSQIDINCNSDDNCVDNRLANDLILTFIFKETTDVQMVLRPNDSIPITTEGNVLRFMARFAAKLRPQLGYLYEGMDDISTLTSVDNFVDEINAKLLKDSVNNQINYISHLDSILSSKSYLCGKSPTIADLLLWSGVKQMPELNTKSVPNLRKWYQLLTQFILTQTQLN